MHSNYFSSSNRLRFLAPAPTKRNAIIVFSLAFLVIFIISYKVLVIDANMDQLRIGANKNEVYGVGENEKMPVMTLFLLGSVPLLLAVYANYFFLGANGYNTFTNSVNGGAALAGASSSPLLAFFATLRGKLVLFGTSFIASFYLTLSLLSSFALICNYPMQDMAKLCTFSIDVMEAIRAKHGPDSTWIFKGTLIGILRGNKAHNSMILNDHDFDICYDRKLEPEIIDVVRSLGVTYERVSRTESGKNDFIRIYPSWATLMSGHSGPNKIELEACDPQKTVMFGGGQPSSLGRAVALKEGVSGIGGCNNLPVAIPVNYDDYLTREYGSDWRIPKSYNHGGLCAMFPGW